MKVSEFYAACVAISFLALVWLILGVPGVLCCIAAMIMGNCDVGWIDDYLEKPDAQPSPTVADIPIPVRRFGASDVRVPVVDVSTGPASPFKVRRAKVVKRLPANVVVLKPRVRVS